jgi:hypothetical protein
MNICFFFLVQNMNEPHPVLRNPSPFTIWVGVVFYLYPQYLLQQEGRYVPCPCHPDPLTQASHRELGLKRNRESLPRNCLAPGGAMVLDHDPAVQGQQSQQSESALAAGVASLDRFCCLSFTITHCSIISQFSSLGFCELPSYPFNKYFSFKLESVSVAGS